MNNGMFQPIKGKPKWLFNQRSQCAVKVNNEGRTTETVRTDKYANIMEAIDLHEKACACNKRAMEGKYDD